MRLPVFMGLRIVSPQEQDGNPGQEGQGQPGNQCPDAKNVAHVQALVVRQRPLSARSSPRPSPPDDVAIDGVNGQATISGVAVGVGVVVGSGCRGRSNHQLLSDL